MDDLKDKFIAVAATLEGLEPAQQAAAWKAVTPALVDMLAGPLARELSESGQFTYTMPSGATVLHNRSSALEAERGGLLREELEKIIPAEKVEAIVQATIQYGSAVNATTAELAAQRARR